MIHSTDSLGQYLCQTLAMSGQEAQLTRLRVRVWILYDTDDLKEQLVTDSSLGGRRAVVAVLNFLTLG